LTIRGERFARVAKRQIHRLRLACRDVWQQLAGVDGGGVAALQGINVQSHAFGGAVADVFDCAFYLEVGVVAVGAVVHHLQVGFEFGHEGVLGWGGLAAGEHYNRYVSNCCDD